MTNTSLLLFTQENCPPCYRLKSFINTLPSEVQDAIEIVPMKTSEGKRTALAEELDVTLTPTFVVANEQIVCEEPDEAGIRVCDLVSEPIETIVGGLNITTALPGLYKNYVTFND